MPEAPFPKLSPHPAHDTVPRDPVPPRRAAVAYAELQVTSNFTFLTGASQPEELVRRAAELGYRAIAITDTNTLAGIVRAKVAAEEAGIQLAVGCRIALACERSVLVYPTDRASYARLSRLLTVGKRRAPKGECHLALDDLREYADGLLAIVLPRCASGEPDGIDSDYLVFARELKDAFDSDRLSLAAPRLYGPDDRGFLTRIARVGERAGIPLVATNDVHYHVPERRRLQDVLVCIRRGCTIDEAGHALFPNGERYLKPPRELARLHADRPHALARTIELAERAEGFHLDQLTYQYPDEICPAGCSPMRHLIEITERGAAEHYPSGVPTKVRAKLDHEFRLIAELDYAPYFLTVHDLVAFARSRGILCQGRGAAANSAVCYCLGVTAVDPERIDMLFERFVSKERDEPPDIDVDFEHERREEVIQYIYAKYGRERAALTAEVISYRAKSAIRDVGKALGFSLDCVDRFAKDLDWWHEGIDTERVRALGLDPKEPMVIRYVQLVDEILGFPRHLSQHVGGFVITRGPLCELVPIENAAMEDRTVIEWDKDDIDAMGMLKVDVLGLGMLTAVRKALALAGEHTGSPLDITAIPPEDPAVYDMICAADTVGVFQIESRAQMSMLPRLRPREFYDLVIEVAIVRPGPIQGDMVHPYLRRRNGEEPVEFPSEDVREVLAKTLGVPLFQEQAMALAIVAAGFTAGQADELRRAMAAWKRKSDRLEALCAKLHSGMIERGYTVDFAKRLGDQIMGFGEYGFPESHAASFALIVYVSAWLKHHHPAAFAAALINSQPMGFYAPAQLVRDAKDHGVEVRPVDVNASAWDCTLERRPDGAPALRLGMRLVKGLRQEEAEAIANTGGPFGDVESLRRASGARVATLRALAYADAFTSMGLDRQKALWAVRGLRDGDTTDLWSTPASEPPAPEPRLPEVTAFKRVLHDYASTRLSLKAHPVSFVRSDLDALGVATAAELRDAELYPNGRSASAAGIVLVRQRPGTAKGIIFMTLEDETGISNLIIRPEVFEKYRSAARHASTVLAHGRVERSGEVVHLFTTKIESLDRVEEGSFRSRDFH
ncbi:MAG: error-prone DNA polymerase [bacterium]|nr:error-prone DNA polymerase [bacterium]